MKDLDAGFFFNGFVRHILSDYNQLMQMQETAEDVREIHSVCWRQSEMGRPWRTHYILSAGSQSKGVEFRHRSAGGAKQRVKR